MNVAVQAKINGPAADIYAALADYRNHHPNILPEKFFTGLEVEEGGSGAGTVFQAGLKMMGQEQKFRMRVTEPEPGRVIAETDVATDLVTKFTVEPRGDTQSEVTISTNFQPSSGFKGWIERLVLPGYLRRVYRAELRQLDEYINRG